jgi:hypothetical protein
MGRPLNKKYFGNRNIGTDGTFASGNTLSNTSAEIGGKSIASFNITSRGSWLANNVSPNVPVLGLAVPAPQIADGIQATWSVTYCIDTVVTHAGHTGLVVGDTYASSLFPGSVITVATVPGSGDATFTVTNAGSTGNLPFNTTNVSITQASGTGVGTFNVNITTKLATANINNVGSGYTEEQVFTITLANDATGTPPTISIVLTQPDPTQAAGSVGDREPAIIAYAYVGGNAVEVDIARQVSTDRYRINKNGEYSRTGAHTGKLKETGVVGGTFTGNEGAEMNIWAFDASGNSYLVKKLTARKAVVYPFACARLDKSAGSIFAAGTAVPWKFFPGQANASAGYVKIENA